MLRAFGAAREPGLLDQLGPADEVHHALGDRLGAGRDGDPAAVGAAVGVARRVVDRAVAPALLLEAERLPDRGLRAEQREDRLDQRRVDHLAAAGGGARLQRGHDREGGGERGDAVGEAERRQRGRAVRLAGDRGEAAHRLGERAEAGPRAVRPELAEAGDARDDEAGVERVQHLGADAPAFERAGSEVLDQHVGVGDELLEELRAVGVAEVQRDRLLVAADHLPPQRHAVLDVAVAAHRVAALGVLDLDHVGAEVAEHGRGHRSGEERCQVDHLEARERAGGEGSSRRVGHAGDPRGRLRRGEDGSGREPVSPGVGAGWRVARASGGDGRAAGRTPPARRRRAPRSGRARWRRAR